MNLRRYERIVGKEVMDGIHEKVKGISEKHILCVSSTYQGGGVAELLNSLVILFNKMGLSFGWRILHGSPNFFKIMKEFHNALHGERIKLSKMKKIYLEMNRRFSTFTHIDHDLVIVYDPQPLPLIAFHRKKQPWIFRCHIDISNPAPDVWNYLGEFIKRYDHLVISNEEYRKNFTMPQTVIYPAIDPLTTKNKPISGKTIDRYMTKFGIDNNKPIISQISRFDKWKDPIGVMRVFELVRKRMNCQLILLGSFAFDDPEGQRIFEKVEKMAGRSRYKEDINLILNGSDILVNCLQRHHQLSSKNL